MSELSFQIVAECCGQDCVDCPLKEGTVEPR